MIVLYWIEEVHLDQSKLSRQVSKKVLLLGIEGRGGLLIVLIGRFVLCKMCTPMCASARVASSNIIISEYRSHRELGY